MSDKINEEKQKGPLHIVITPSGAGKLDQSYGHFQLEKGGDFSVTIREFADKKEKIDKEELEARKFIDGKLLSNTAYQQLDKKQRDTYDANVAVYNQNTKLRTKRGSSLVSTFSEVAWVWQLAGKGVEAAKLTLNEQIGFGIAGNIGAYGYRRFNFPTLLEGGGMVWLEPFIKQESPTGKIPHGCFISAKGTAEIIDTIWTDTNNNPIADTRVQFGSVLYLHVYSKGLYGQGVDVKLIDRDAFSFNDELKLAEDSKGLKQFSFTKEVNVTKGLPFENGKPGVSGNLLDQGTDPEGKDFRSTTYVQKCKVLVFIDPAWKDNAGGELKIFPVIKSAERGTFFERFPRKYLIVSQSGKLYEDPAISGNNIMMVDEVETNVAAFHPCGYNLINVRNNERAFDVYKKGGQAFQNTFEVVAGTIFTQPVEITLDDLASTDDCRLKSNPATHHKGQVFTIATYPEKGIAAADEQNHHSRVSVQSTNKVSIGAVSDKSKHIITLDGIKLKVNEKTDKKLRFQSRFIYDTRPVAGQLPYILRYFWIGTGAPGLTKYVVNIDSCRNTRHALQVIVYPDVKWSLRLEYKNQKSEYIKETKEVGSNQRYKDTPKAKFKREPSKWTTPDKQGRSLGLDFKAKFNNKPADYQENADKTYSAAKNEGEEWDLTADLLEKLEKTLKPLNDIADLLTSILDGKKNGNTGDQPTAEHRAALESVKNDPKNKALTDLQDDFDKNIQKQRAAAPDSPEHKQAVREAGLLQRKMDSRSKSLGLKLTRAPVGMEIYYPEFALEFDWSRVPVKNPGYEHLFNKTAVFLDGVIEAKPLIGIKMFLDFLALAQRAHPIALALIAAADIAMSLIGDGSKITLEISATAIVGGKLQGFFNTLTGENTFNNKDRDANSKALADISGDITVKVSASVKMAICKRAFFIVVKGDLDVGVEAEAKFTVKTTLDFDDTGIFFNPEASFDGIQLKGKANIKLDAGKEDGPAFVKVDSKNEFIYQAIDRQKPAKIGKVYFKKFE